MPMSERPTILVTGPALAGVTAVARALQVRLGPGYRVVECLGPGQRSATVVFVSSAAAPMADADAAVLDDAAADTDAVVGAVSKIDVHRTWPQVLEANRNRYPHLAWVGVAADPQIGAVRLDRLAGAVLATLALCGRERSRGGESAPRSRAARTLLLRSRIQQARVHLAGQARALCVSLRAELRHEAAGVPRGGVDAFCSRAHRRSTQVAAEFDATLSTALPRLVGLPAGPFSASAPACPALESYLPRFDHPRSDDRLAVLLSVGFGLGVTFTVGRSLVYLVPAWWPAVVAGCIAAGIALTFWVTRTRSLLAERAALDRWSAELAAGLRAALDDQLVIQLLAAETALAARSGIGPSRDRT